VDGVYSDWLYFRVLNHNEQRVCLYMISQHPLRCETCKKYKWNGCIALAKDTSLISVVGCASHSDAEERGMSIEDFVSLSGKMEIAVRNDEREKVLDEVLKLPARREQPNGSMYIYVNDVKELRLSNREERPGRCPCENWDVCSDCDYRSDAETRNNDQT
jgi:hypothetical protein